MYADKDRELLLENDSLRSINTYLTIELGKAREQLKNYEKEPPVAKISPTTSCLVAEPVNFDGSASTSSTGNLTYRWNFGDGDSADGAKVSHVYKKAGTYRVILTVSDSSAGDCGMASDSIMVVVNTRPEAVITVR